MQQDLPEYTWDAAAVGHEAPGYRYLVTDEAIAAFSGGARYENLVYTSQPAARDTGLPGIIAPPSMLFLYAPLRLASLAAAHGYAAPADRLRLVWSALGAKVGIEFHGRLVQGGDVVTSTTGVSGKGEDQRGRFLAFRVEARTDAGGTVASYSLECPWD